MADANTGKLVDDLARHLTTLADFEFGGKQSDVVKTGKAILDANLDLAGHAKIYQQHRELLKEAFNADGKMKPLEEFSETVQNAILKAAKAEGIEDAGAKKAAINTLGDDFQKAKKALTEFATADANKAAIADMEKAGKKLGGFGGLVASEGWAKTIQKNMTELDGRQLKVAGRWGVVLLGSVGVADGIFRSQTTDGDRSVVTRFGEIAVCGAAAAAALLASRAHVRV